MAEPAKGIAYDFPVGLEPTNGNGFIPDPTITAGDFQISKDYGEFVDLENLPVVTPANSGTVKISLSAAEMTADKIVISIKDLLGDEWRGMRVFIDVPPNVTLSDLKTIDQNTLDILQGDITETHSTSVVKKRGTSTVLVNKKVAGSLLKSGITITMTDA